MKKCLLVFMIFMMMLGGIGCGAQSEIVEPKEGVTFAVDFDGTPKYDAYEFQLVYSDQTGNTGFLVVTLEKKSNYQVTWSQSLVDEKQGESYEMTAYQSYGNSGPDKDKPLSDTRTLVFQDGATNEGRLVKITVLE